MTPACADSYIDPKHLEEIRARYEHISTFPERRSTVWKQVKQDIDVLLAEVERLSTDFYKLRLTDERLRASVRSICAEVSK